MGDRHLHGSKLRKMVWLHLEHYYHTLAVDCRSLPHGGEVRLIYASNGCGRLIAAAESRAPPNVRLRCVFL